MKEISNQEARRINQERLARMGKKHSAAKSFINEFADKLRETPQNISVSTETTPGTFSPITKTQFSGRLRLKGAGTEALRFSLAVDQIGEGKVFSADLMLGDETISFYNPDPKHSTEVPQIANLMLKAAFDPQPDRNDRKRLSDLLANLQTAPQIRRALSLR